MFQHIAKFLSHLLGVNFFCLTWVLGRRFHLKRIIVIPAVYQSLARLKPSLRYWHWADVTNYTHLYRLAVGCVFVKQSDLLCYCTL